MPHAIIEALKRFNEPHMRSNCGYLTRQSAQLTPRPVARKNFARCSEACTGFELTLIESVTRCPVEFNVLMINRLLNGGVVQINNQSLLSVLVSVSSNPTASAEVKRSAQLFVEYQQKRGRADA